MTILTAGQILNDALQLPAARRAQTRNMALTVGEFEALTPAEQAVWSRHWLDAYIHRCATAELLAEIGSFDQRDLHERFGSGDE